MQDCYFAICLDWEGNGCDNYLCTWLAVAPKSLNGEFDQNYPCDSLVGAGYRQFKNGLYTISGKDEGPFADLPDDGSAGGYKTIIKAVTEHYWVRFLLGFAWLLLWCSRVCMQSGIKAACEWCKGQGMTEHPDLAKKADKGFTAATDEK